MAAGIDNVTIDKLAKAIGINNKLDTLGLRLGFVDSDMKMYNAKNHVGGDVTWHGTKSMLIDWQDNTPQEQQRGKLSEALKDAGLIRFSEQYLGDEVPTTKSEEVDRSEPKKVQTHMEKQPRSHSNTINAPGSSNVSGNTMIGEQTNVYNQSAPTPSVVHHHNTTVMQQQPPRSIPVPVYIPRPTASKRASTVPQGPAPKRQKVTQSSQARPSTSKQTVAKPKKVPSQRKTAPKQKGTKQKSQKAQKAPQKKAPKKTATKKTPTAPKKKAPKTKAPKKTPQKKPKKPPKSKQPKSQKPKGSKPKKSKKK